MKGKGLGAVVIAAGLCSSPAFCESEPFQLARLETPQSFPEETAALRPVHESAPILLLRDKAYERTLRQCADPDQTLTPARFWRWMRSLAGHGLRSLSASSSAEFQPILNVVDTQVRIIAAIAYKF